MKHFISIIFTLTTFYSFAQTSDGSVNEVLNHMKMQEKAWNEGDIKGFMNYYWKSDSLKFIGSKGITYGWQKTLDNYIKSYPTKNDMGILTFTIVEGTQLSEKSIYVIGKWELKKDKPVGGYFTLLWKLIDDKWVIVADHTS